MADKRVIQVPRHVLVELLRLVMKCLDLLDDVSRSRWEFNRTRMELTTLMAKLDPSISHEAQAGTVDSPFAEKTPTRTESQLLKQQLRQYVETDDEPTSPGSPRSKKSSSFRRPGSK